MDAFMLLHTNVALVLAENLE